MAEEFDEAEVVFSEDLSSVFQREDEDENHLFGLKERNKSRRIVKRKKKVTALSSSLPVNIPENMFRRHVEKEEGGHSEEEEEYSNGRGEIVPPHVIVGRRIQGEGGGQMAFSVCSELNFTVNTLCHGFISFELLPLRSSFVLSKEFSYNNGGAAKNWSEENSSSCIKLITWLCELMICMSLGRE
ncbi:unnamed protein product [Brassica rapa]|uniref:Uncharacterized protein n=1 Tax=Brassica campestris TaxID=3711 RepID=A0A3P6D5Y5_BRACM|nr:unnamed protein product [Brassica rapa]VDD14779.1 unnamed protein product [Brassica rapa]